MISDVTELGTYSLPCLDRNLSLATVCNAPLSGYPLSEERGLCASEHLGDGRPVTAQRQAQPAELLGLLCTQYDKWQ